MNEYTLKKWQQENQALDPVQIKNNILIFNDQKLNLENILISELELDYLALDPVSLVKIINLYVSRTTQKNSASDFESEIQIHEEANIKITNMSVARNGATTYVYYSDENGVTRILPKINSNVDEIMAAYRQLMTSSSPITITDLFNHLEAPKHNTSNIETSKSNQDEEISLITTEKFFEYINQETQHSQRQTVELNHYYSYVKDLIVYHSYLNAFLRNDLNKYQVYIELLKDQENLNLNQRNAIDKYIELIEITSQDKGNHEIESAVSLELKNTGSINLSLIISAVTILLGVIIAMIIVK